MRILIIGSGGREHALAWALSRDSYHPELFVAPGNPGTRLIGRNIPIPASDIPALQRFARTEGIDLTIVGPEQPLVMGIVDAFESDGLRIIGPTARAAQLEGSKAFSKAFMERNGIPSAAHKTFRSDSYADAMAYLEAQGVPIVIKASGLAAGKGAIVCTSLEDAKASLDLIMKERAFGDAGDFVVIEEFMEGEEASIFILTDGQSYVLLPTAQDHKRVGEGDTGPNTGGMGAYGPAPVVTPAMLSAVTKEIIEPTLDGMEAEGYPYRGFLYCGLMITSVGPKVVEFNCRLGDPEAQVILPLLDGDLVPVLEKQCERRLNEVRLPLREESAVCVVLASEGYPGDYKKGARIHGLEQFTAEAETIVFHAGTKLDEDGHVVTAGGRVLGVTSVGSSLEEAVNRTYTAVGNIQFEGMHFRRDIGRKGLSRIRARA